MNNILNNVPHSLTPPENNKDDKELNEKIFWDKLRHIIGDKAIRR